jgi:hypothetical protein
MIPVSAMCYFGAVLHAWRFHWYGDPHVTDHMTSDAAHERRGYQGAVRHRARPPPAAALPPGPRSHRGADPQRTHNHERGEMMPITTTDDGTLVLEFGTGDVMAVVEGAPLALAFYRAPESKPVGTVTTDMPDVPPVVRIQFGDRFPSCFGQWITQAYIMAAYARWAAEDKAAFDATIKESCANLVSACIPDMPPESVEGFASGIAECVTGEEPTA